MGQPTISPSVKDNIQMKGKGNKFLGPIRQRIRIGGRKSKTFHILSTNLASS
jgi:hypothetical protein